MLCLVLILFGGVNDVGSGFDNRLAADAFDNDLSARDVVADLLRGMTRYRQTRYSQNVATVSNVPTIRPQRTDADDVGLNFHMVNPNRLSPYAGPAGMDGLSGWISETYYQIPARIKTWTGRVEIFQGGMLPKRQWRYPDGSRFVEVLSHGGAVFEVRQRVKTADGWKSSVPYRYAAAYPDGYTGKLAKSCNECHSKAGASEQYGITVRGDDGVFSYPVLKEGTMEFDESMIHVTRRGMQTQDARAQDASRPKDGLILQREKAYHAVVEAVERTGESAVYESHGPASEGWMLPNGRYRIERDADGDAAYERIEPIPKPDPAMFRVEDCIGQS